MSSIKFDDHQRAAIEAPRTDQVIVAGAGSGKTTVLAARIRHLIEVEKIDPSDIYAMTFTQAGGRALREKVGRQIGWSGTLHAFAIEALGISLTSILSEDEAEEIIASTISTLRLKAMPVSKAKAILMSGTNDQIGNEKVFMAAFQAEVATRRKTTFDLILRRFAFAREGATSLRRPAVLVIDEYQDTSPLDAACYWSMRAGTMITVGDMRQAIYQFRGASPAAMRATIRSVANPHIHRLPTTWRCSRAVVAAANSVTGIATDEPDALRAGRDEEGKVGILEANDQLDEARAIRAFVGWELEKVGNVAVLARTNREVDAQRAALSPFYHIMPRTSDRSRTDTDTEQLHLHLRMLIGEIDVETFLRKIPVGQRDWLELRSTTEATRTALETTDGDVLAAMERLWAPESLRNHEALRDAPTIEAALAHLMDLEDNTRRAPATPEPASATAAGALYVDTVHGVKGMEFDTVILAGADERWDQETEETSNLLYVAITRARSNFYAVAAKNVIDTWTGMSLNRHASARITKATN